MPKILLQNRHTNRIATLAEYRHSGGYEMLTTLLGQSSTQVVRQKIADAVLLGRGGAAFPAGAKLMSVAEEAPFPRYLICNADEMEPGTFKDRILLHADPHQLIEGMVLTAYAVLAEEGIIFIRPEYESAAQILEREVAIARKAGYLGKNICNSNFSFDITIHRSGGRYICGEGSALINALMGRRPNPQKPPPYPTEKGLWGKPTIVNNVETLCYIPHILRHGTEWFQGLALTEGAAGTKLFGISGKVNQPGCYELPLGIPLSEIIETHAGGMCPGSEFKACIPGGASTGYVPRQHYHIPMDFESLKAIGNRLGTAAIMVFDHKTCLVAATINLTQFFARESCGWCTPCREGFPYLLDLLQRIENGAGERAHMDKIRQMCHHLTHAYCAFAPGGIAPIESLLAHFEAEVMAHIDAKKCPFKL